METKCYRITCKDVSLEFTVCRDGGVEVVTNMVNGHQQCQFEDFRLFPAFLNLCKDYGFEVKEYQYKENEKV